MTYCLLSLMHFANHKTSYCVIAGITLIVVLGALRLLYSRLYSARHSAHQARLVRFQIGLAVLIAIFATGFFLLWGLVFSPTP